MLEKMTFVQCGVQYITYMFIMFIYLFVFF